MSLPPLRVVIIDDSAYSRRKVADMLSGSRDIEVVGRARDGEEALRLAMTLKPDVFTLDLEMPRMDGFSFLRILMAKQPTPVIVVSGYSQKENVFKALELGAVDFVAKPDRLHPKEADELRKRLISKVLMTRHLRRMKTPSLAALPTELPSASPKREGLPLHLVVIAASTGGPAALLEIFSKLRAEAPVSVLVAQHMPEKFTRTFAERLDRRGPLRVSEAQGFERIVAGTGYVCPGQRSMEVEALGHGFGLRVVAPSEEDRYVPSADRLFASAAKVAGSLVTGVILTGMGDDGSLGARALREIGADVIVESQETAVIHGMPGAALRAGVASRTMPLPEIAEYLASLGAPSRKD